MSTTDQSTARADSAADETLGQVPGRYKLLEKLGEGGCGVVYVAEQTEPVRRRVALKVIKLGMDTKQVVARFEAERQALAMMDHPNIAKVLDAGATETGRPYFVMELVRGIRITEYCDQNNLATKARLELFIPVCQAIQHAHQKGIIHRDIKPSNILVTLHDGVPLPKVIDFGIAKATEGRLTDATVYTQLHQFIGTPAYMSPEQAEMSGLDVDTRSDIYSLGVLLYELLTGRTPFNPNELLSQGIDAMRKTIREKEPPRPSTRLATLEGAELTTTAKRRSLEAPKLIHLLKGDLDWVVMKCLEKDRTRRYETANGLAADLKRHLTNEPVVARPPSTLYRVQKTVRRNKLVFAAGAMVALAIIAGLLVSAWSFLKEREARRLAVGAEQRAESALKQEASLRRRAEEASVAAEKAGRETSRALADSDFQQALRLLEENKSRNALAYLARSLSLSPTSAAATRLASLLASRAWMAPTIVTSNSSFANFSPDGKQVATADLDGFVRVWDSTSGQEILKPLFFGDQMLALGYSPDGKYLTAVSSTKALSWDTAAGRQLAVSAPFPGLITAGDTSRVGKRGAIGFSDGTVWLLESPTLKLLSDKIKDTSPIWLVRFSKDGTKLLTGANGGTARVWDVRTGAPLTQPLKAGRFSVRGGDFSPDSSKAAVADGSTVAIWDLSSGAVAAAFAHSNDVAALEFSPDGKQLLTASADGTARLSDAATGKVLLLLQHDSAVLSARFSPDGQWVLTTCADESAHLWDARTGRQITEPLSDAGGWAFLSPDGLRIVTVSAQKVVRLWDSLGAPQLPESFTGEQDAAWAASFSPDGKRLAIGSPDGTIRLYDAASAGRLATSLKSHVRAHAIVFSPDGSRLVEAPDSGSTEIWDVKTGERLAGSIPHASSSAPRFSPDGSMLLTWSVSNSARVWDARTGRQIGAPLQHKDRVTAAEFSPDGQRVVTGSRDGTARVWQTQTGEPLGPPLVQHEGIGIGLVRFSPDGERIATAAADGVLQLWDARTGRPLPITIHHIKPITAFEFSHEGRRILTASADGSARIWDAVSGRPLAPPMTHSDVVWFAGFSPDGSRVFTCSTDRTIRLWDALTARPLADPLPFFDVPGSELSPDGRRLLIHNRDGPLIWDLPPSEGTVPDWLPSLAEAVAGVSLEPRPQIPDSHRAFAALRARLQGAPADPWTLWGRWMLADPQERTISPMSRMPLATAIERILALGSPDFLQKLTVLARGDTELLQRIELALTQVERQNGADALDRESDRLQSLGLMTEALAKLREAADLGSAKDQNSLAWELATSEDDRIRDGRTALKYALKAVENSQHRDANVLDTLAAAYAETGDFKRAVAVEEEALGLLAEESWLRKDFMARLELFKAGKPAREP